MLYIVEYNLYKSPEKKINNIVNNIIDKVPGGDKFFDMLDDEIKDPKNIDITIALFKKIYDKYNYNYNLVLSGSFGESVLDLISKGVIKCLGTIVVFTGSLTSHKNKMGIISSNKEVKIKFQSNNIRNKEFIFVDDSYYSGTTYKLIDKFISTKGSNIKEVYVIYDGNDTKDKNRHSLYSYYDNHSGRSLDKSQLINKLNKVDNVNTIEISKLINNGEIKTNRDLINAINYYWKKDGIDRYIDPRNFNFDNQF